jgi:hypothetical protein
VTELIDSIRAGTAAILCCLLLLCGLGGKLTGAEDQAAVERDILKTRSYWRVFTVLRPPLWGTAADARPEPKFIPSVRLPEHAELTAPARDGTEGKRKVPALPPDQPHSPAPPDEWIRPEFDDSGWWRDPGPFFGGGQGSMQRFSAPHGSRYGDKQTFALARLCVRGKFFVADPEKVESLTFNAEFRGGLVVYLNGVEVARRYLPDGPLGRDTLAEDYPDNAWFNSKGAPLGSGPHSRSRDHSAFHPRVREMPATSLPPSLLRRGVNVLAMEVRRTALSRRVMEYRRSGIKNIWCTVGLIGVELQAEGEGIVPNISRPDGVQVWNSTVLEAVFDTDYGDPTEKLKPMRIVAARNGSFSGQTAIGSDREIEGLEADVGSLRRKGGKEVLPPAVIRWPRYGRYEPYGKSALPGISGGALKTFDALLETPPAVVSAREKRVRNTEGKGVSIPVGAVQPLWLSVRIPSDAVPGVYEGDLTLRWKSADVGTMPTGAPMPPFIIPVQVEVCNFRLPPPCDFRSWSDFIQSPDSLALRYEVLTWSEEHWKLIENTFRLLAQVGNKTLYVPLIARTHYGNEQTMVRWIRREGGGWEHDFSIMEKYLDLALKCGIKPAAVVFYVWDYRVGHLASGTRRAFGEFRWGHLGTSSRPPGFRPVEITSLHPLSGKIETIEGPAYNEVEATAFWTPVAAGLQERLKERGLGDTAMLGIVGDNLPQREVVELWKKVLPSARWMARTHGGADRLHGETMGYLAKVCCPWAVDPGIARSYGWRREFPLKAYFPRLYDNLPQTFHRLTFEWNLQSGRAGLGQLAADFFGYGRRNRACVTGRFSAWGTMGLRGPWLAAGARGAVATVRFELARECIQECEARVYLERILTDPAFESVLSAELRQRARNLLDERTRRLAWACEYDNVFSTAHSFLVTSTGGVLGGDWYAGGDRWQRLSLELFKTAGAVQAAIR